MLGTFQLPLSMPPATITSGSLQVASQASWDPQIKSEALLNSRSQAGHVGPPNKQQISSVPLAHVWVVIGIVSLLPVSQAAPAATDDMLVTVHTMPANSYIYHMARLLPSCVMCWSQRHRKCHYSFGDVGPSLTQRKKTCSSSLFCSNEDITGPSPSPFTIQAQKGQLGSSSYSYSTCFCACFSHPSIITAHAKAASSQDEL